MSFASLQQQQKITSLNNINRLVFTMHTGCFLGAKENNFFILMYVTPILRCSVFILPVKIA